MNWNKFDEKNTVTDKGRYESELDKLSSQIRLQQLIGKISGGDDY